GDGTFGDAFTFTSALQTYPWSIVAGRLNADAYDDLVLNHAGNPGLEVYLSDGAGGYALSRLSGSADLLGGETQELVDWDGADDPRTGLDFYYQTTARSFAEPMFLELVGPPGFSDLRAVDVNQDGWIDLVGPNLLFLNDGTGSLTLSDAIGDPEYWLGRADVGI